MKPLETPPTIRLPHPEELPDNPEVFEKLRRRSEANITQGYTLTENDAHDLPFRFYAEINVDNSRFWNLFKALAVQLPTEVSCIYNLFDEEPIFSDYISREKILDQLQKHQLELTQDCNLEFGLIYHSEEMLEEVFVTDSKYLKVWGNDETSFRKLMQGFGLNENSELNFVDEFPKVVLPLSDFHQQAKPPGAIIEELNLFFETI